MDLLSLAEGLSHSLSQVQSLFWLNVLYQYRREPQEVQERAERVITLAKTQKLPLFVGWGQCLLGWALAHLGQAKEGSVQIRQGLATYRATGSAVDQTHLMALLAEVYGIMRRREEGLNVVDEAMGLVCTTGEGYYEAELHRIKGELIQLEDATETVAESCFLRAIEVAQRQQAKSLELRAIMSLCRLWQKQGRHTEALQILAEIYHWFTEGFATRDLKEAKALLDELQMSI
ncbi:hypothetical protein KFU94_07760 [Chloroflexi bacterium TSY]|nr:hypothetical protein [Chloroflexi bacterium TSY]